MPSNKIIAAAARRELAALGSSDGNSSVDGTESIDGRRLRRSDAATAEQTKQSEDQPAGSSLVSPSSNHKHVLTNSPQTTSYSMMLPLPLQGLETLHEPNFFAPRGERLVPGLRMELKKSILVAHDIHKAIEEIQQYIGDVQWKSEIAQFSMRGMLEGHKARRDAILNLDPSTLTPYEQGLIHLVRYKNVHGDLKIKITYKGDDPVMSNAAQFVERIRTSYRTFKKGPKPDAETNSIRHEQYLAKKECFDLLTEFGIVWQTGESRSNWDEMFESLVQWKEEKGNCNVPQLTPKLGPWLSHQRKAYQATISGTDTRIGPLSAERIKKMEELGVVWKLRHGRPKKGDAKYRNKRQGIGYDSDDKKDESQDQPKKHELSEPSNLAPAKKSRSENSTNAPIAMTVPVPTPDGQSYRNPFWTF